MKEASYADLLKSVPEPEVLMELVAPSEFLVRASTKHCQVRLVDGRIGTVKCSISRSGLRSIRKLVQETPNACLVNLKADGFLVRSSGAEATRELLKRVRAILGEPGVLKPIAKPKPKTKAHQKFNVKPGSCVVCGYPLVHLHHLVPRSKGGTDDPSNLIDLCPNHHALVHLLTSSKDNATLLAAALEYDADFRRFCKDNLPDSVLIGLAERMRAEDEGAHKVVKALRLDDEARLSP